MQILSLVCGSLAVVLYLLCYQLKARRHIILCNIISRVLYVLQYCLLGEFIGAVMDISAIPSSAIAGKKDHCAVRKFRIPIIISVNLVIIGLGIAFFKEWYSILAIFGVLFETVALWFTKENHIRVISLFGAPFWLVYNLICGAYASCIGNLLAICSIVIALLRYKENNEGANEKNKA